MSVKKKSNVTKLRGNLNNFECCFLVNLILKPRLLVVQSLSICVSPLFILYGKSVTLALVDTSIPHAGSVT